jgi:hypothetical protein
MCWAVDANGCRLCCRWIVHSQVAVVTLSGECLRPCLIMRLQTLWPESLASKQRTRADPAHCTVASAMVAGLSTNHPQNNTSILCCHVLQEERPEDETANQQIAQSAAHLAQHSFKVSTHRV